MTFRKSILLLISLGMIAALVACSSSSSHPITVTLSAVSSPLTVNSQTPVTATVANDSANGGVTWSCSGATPCGTFSATTSASGTPVNYIAPAFPESGVIITATSVTNTAIKASTPAITIGAATLADGNYTFSVNGLDNADFSLYNVSGVFTVSGGVITAGEQDFGDYDFVLNDQINPTGSTITSTADGGLQIVLTTCTGTCPSAPDPDLGVAGVETLNASVYPLNAAKAAITEFDTAATASGELDLQDSTAITATPGPAGYAFGLSGFDTNELILSIGGVINVDDLGGTVGTISGAGSIFDANDNSSGTTFQAETFAASTVSAPDAFGRVTFTLNPTDSVNFPQIILVGYIVNANKIFLVETSDSYFGTTGGTAFSQGANTGTFTATSVSGLTYVAGLNGFDGAGAANAAGMFTLNADTTISGFINYNDLSGTGVQAPSPLTGGNWAEDVGTGRVSLIGVTDGTATFNAEIYLDGNGKLLTITLDTTDNLAGRGFQQSGVGAFTAASFSGPYSMGATGWDIGENTEFDAVGTVTADGVGAIAGVTDLNAFFTPTSDVAVLGTFTSASSGVFTGTITGLDVTTPANSDAFSYYLVDPTGDNIAIETDPNQVTLGYFVQQ